jgi:hypothetical protein
MPLIAFQYNSYRLLAGLFLGLLTLSISTITPPASNALSSATPPASIEDQQEGFTIYRLNPGTPLFVLLQTPVDTAINQPDDPIEAAVAQDLYLGAKRIISRNARLRGIISRLEKPIQGRNAILAFRFNEITLGNGDVLPIQAHVKTERPDYTWGGELTEGTKPMKVTHRVEGIGFYNKIVYGGPRAMGAHLRYLPGERLTIILEQPLAIVLPKDPD